MQRVSVSSQRGVTLIELLLYLTLSSTLAASLYQTLASQQKSYLHQNATAELQQNLRTGLYLLTKDIHSAGYNPKRKTGNTFGFVNAFPSPNNQFTINYASQSDIIALTTDADGDGVLTANDTEMIAYRLNATSHTLERFKATSASSGGIWEAIAENVEAVNFVTLAKDGTVTTTASNIRAVEISLLVRADKPDPKIINKQVYKNKRGTVLCSNCTGDHYPRRLLITTVQARSLS